MFCSGPVFSPELWFNKRSNFCSGGEERRKCAAVSCVASGGNAATVFVCVCVLSLSRHKVT